MLKLRNIVKEYPTGDTSVVALKGIDVEFRKSEFVSILGHSGCGKTTLLNIIGGLDQYTTGDLIIEGKSTKDFKDSDWDTYRNHSVGFVFQNYNLIPHQTVLSNVELALTLSGVSKAERKQRAIEALEKVGLGDQINKKPNQMSGGQMQRVAIARALVNDPEILLADEPTGALDSETSVQIMEILKEISAEKLIIMVTHNPELAEEYSTRIIRLIDGKIVDDSNPYTENEQTEETSKEDSKADKKAYKKENKKRSMSFFTALSLSLNNLLTKKMRTFLTSFAGSIGIIGIALILSLSSGFQAYIDAIQQETLTSYPVTVESATMDLNGMAESMAGNSSGEVGHELDKVYSNTMAASMAETFTSEIWSNDLASFKKFLESGNSGIEPYVSSIQYTYGGKMNIFAGDTSESLNQVYPSPIIDMMASMVGNMNIGGMGMDLSSLQSYEKYYNSWQEILNNDELLESQYDVITGTWPKNYNEVVLIIDKNNEISDLAIQGLGITDQQDMIDSFMAMQDGENFEAKKYEIEYKDIIGKTFKLVLEPDYFAYDEDAKVWNDMHDDETYSKMLVDNGEEIKIVGIIRPKEGSLMVATTGAIGYTSKLTEYVVNKTNECEIVKQQKANPDIDVFTGIPFPAEESKATEAKAEEKKEAEISTAAAKDVSLSCEIEKPVVSSLMKDEKAPEIRATAGITDFSNAKPVTEEEVYASIDAVYSGNEAAQMKRLVELMLKDSLSKDEKNELIGYLDEMLKANPIQGINVSGKQAYNLYLSKMNRENKLKMLSAMMAENGVATAPEETPEETPVEEEKEPEPQPLAKSYKEALEILGVGDISKPLNINIYPLDFESKDAIAGIIKKYNEDAKASGNGNLEIKYTDYIGLLLSSVTKIVNVISYVLISFVAISLVVSSIMIGIITYISVLERTKEIGILRAIGASKKDISRVFNAETLIVGFVSGSLGILITILLNIPINMIIQHLTKIPNVSQLPVMGGIILVCISMFLTLIAGLIPSGIASRKDPVVALRTE